MRFHPFVLAAVATLALSACVDTTPTAVHYDISLHGVTAEQAANLPKSITNVIGGRLARLGIVAEDLTVKASGSGQMVTADLTIPAGVANELTAELTTPYTLRFLRQSGSGETIATTVSKYGNFSESGLTESHVNWISAGTDADGLGTVTIAFNDAGHTLLKSLATTDAGRQYGLFAKGKLISLFAMEAAFGGDIVLNKIPSAELAAVFADDVDTGLHATFVRATK